MYILYHLLAHLSHRSSYKPYHYMFLFWFLISHHRLVKNLIQSIYFSNSFSFSIWKDINFLILSSTLNVLTYPLLFGIIKINALIALSNFIPIKYLELGFVLINFEITIFSTLTSQIFIGFFCSIKLFFCYFFVSKS